MLKFSHQFLIREGMFFSSDHWAAGVRASMHPKSTVGTHTHRLDFFKISVEF